jgi:hypothetical protein
LEGDFESNFIHFAIQKLHWSPSEIDEWFNASEETQAFYYASTQVKIDSDKKEAAKLKANKGKRQK